MKQTNIDQVSKLIKDSFPIDWMSNYTWSDSVDEMLSAVKEKLAEFRANVFYLFAQSVLRGEYVVRTDYQAKLVKLIDMLSGCELYDDDTNALKSNAIREFNALIYSLVEIIKGYRHLLTTLYNKYSGRRSKFMINAYRVQHRIESTDIYCGFYEILFNIMRIDHTLSYGKKTIEELILYHHKLDMLINDKSLDKRVIRIIDVLNKKSLFLLKKLLIDDNKEFDYMIDFKHFHYDTRKLDLGDLKAVDDRFEFYRTDSYTNDAKGYELDLRARNNNLPIGQYTLLMKYYKDSSKTSNVQINNILADFNRLYDSLIERFTKRPIDMYALGTLKNYMYNCRFSFLMKDPSYTFESLQEDLNEIIGIQCKTGILNFYPYRKAFEKALQLFRLENSNEKAKFEEYKVFLQKCISSFSEAMQWCETNYFYPIQNTYRECLNPFEGFGAVFVASSFCRPVRYDQLRDELNEFKSKLLLFDNETSLREEQDQMRSLKNDIDNSRTREVEILSIFTAIITFLFGAIVFYSDNNENDFVHLIFSIFGLGSVLMIFVSGIHLITMRKEKTVKEYFKHPRMWFSMFTILFCIGLIIWLLAHI